MRILSDMHRVALAVTEGIPIFEVAVPCEVFGIDRPDLVDPWYDFIVCSSRDATVGNWFRSDTPHGLDDLVSADTVIIPSCRDVNESPPGDLVEAVRAAYERGARVASLCSGAFVLAAAGLLNGRRAATHWMHADLLAHRYPEVNVDPRVLFVDDGAILTSAGTAAGIDLCLHMVRSDHGSAVSNALARRLVAPPHRTGGQAQFISSSLPTIDNGRIAELLDWATSNLGRPLSVTELADHVNMSSRNLVRLFKKTTGTTPMHWLLVRRLQRAQEILEVTDDSIEHVAGLAGMGSAATLRRHFHENVGVSPTTYRRVFRSTTTLNASD